jgi:hypothetical protein
MITLQSIVNKLDISPSSVSMAINGKLGGSKSLRQKSGKRMTISERRRS